MKIYGQSILNRLEVTAVISFAVLLCFAGLFYGLPQLLNADELYYVGGAIEMLQAPHLDPEWYGAPASTLMTLLAPVFALYELLGSSQGTLADISSSYGRDTQEFVLIGRFIGMAIYAALGVSFYVYLRGFLSRLGSGVALCALMVSPQVLELSQVVRMDVLLVLFLVVTFHFGNRILLHNRFRDFIFAGLALGAAVVTKYPGVFGCIYIVLAALAAWRRHGGLFVRTYVWLIAAAGASLLAAFAFGPFLFIDYKEMLANVAYESRGRHLSATSGGPLDSLWFYLTKGFPGVSGFPAYLVGILGLGAALASRRRSEPWLLAGFGLGYLGFLLFMPLHWVRYAVPLAPLFAAGVGLAVEEFWTRCPARWRRRGVAALIALALLPSLATCLKTTYFKATGQDTRIEAMAWVKEHIAEGSAIAAEPYTPQLSIENYRVFVPHNGEIRPLSEVWEERIRPRPNYQTFGRALRGAPKERLLRQDIDFLFASTFADRYRREIEHYSGEVAVYDALEANFVEIARFEPGFWTLGPAVTIYARPEVAATIADN